MRDSLVIQLIQHHLFAFLLITGYCTDKIGPSTCFLALLTIVVMADGAPKRGLGANDDVLITVSAI